MFCTNCGNKLEENVTVCPNCGAAAGAPATQPEAPEQPAVETPEQPVTPAEPSPAPVPARGVSPTSLIYTKPVPTAGFFWLMLAFSVPVAGFILSIILSSAPKNLSLKHFAKAVLIWQIIGIIACITLIVLAYFLSGSSLEEILWGIQYLR